MSAPARAEESFPTSPLRVLQERDLENDDDLLFLFLTEDQVFLKLTRTCNNICSFCCDTVFWNGTHMDPERVRVRMREGAQKGLSRIFFSGGEPTIHPDFLRFVREARDLGYQSIVAITNGRMFFYEEFARKAIRGGLTEIVFSLNSHDARTHDALVGVKGAFDQVVEGVGHVRKLGCPFRMNVVVTRKNIEQLPAMIPAFVAMGASGATFLNLVPNDRDWERSRHSIYYETESGRPFVRGALERARALGFSIELKKFPEDFFEGFEEQMPDPLSWALELGEIDWRRPDRHRPWREGGAVKCWGERCSFCAYRPFCTHLMQHQAERREHRFRRFELEGGAPSEPALAALAAQPTAPVTVRATDAAAAREALAAVAGLGERPRAVHLPPGELAGAPAGVALVVDSAEALAAAQDRPGAIEVELNVSTVAWLRAHPEWIVARGAALTVYPQTFLKLEAARRGQVDLAGAFAELPLGQAVVRGVPPCLSGRREGGRADMPVTTALLRAIEDVPAHAQEFYWRRFLTHSTRCAGCAERGACDGVHVNYVRQFGYATLRPLGPVTATAAAEPAP